MTKQTYSCKCCKQPFEARVADRKRGWALYCSKRCKAIKQEAATGQYRGYRERVESGYSPEHDSTAYHAEDPGWDAHKESF